MSKRKNTEFAVSPIYNRNDSILTVVEQSETGLYKMRLPGKDVQFLILKKGVNGLEQISKTKVYEVDFWQDDDLEATAIDMAFEFVKCEICNHNHYAHQITKTPIGNICMYCRMSTTKRVPWIPLDNLVSYVRK